MISVAMSLGMACLGGSGSGPLIRLKSDVGCGYRNLETFQGLEYLFQSDSPTHLASYQPFFSWASLWGDFSDFPKSEGCVGAMGVDKLSFQTEGLKSPGEELRYSFRLFRLSPECSGNPHRKS